MFSFGQDLKTLRRMIEPLSGHALKYHRIRCLVISRCMITMFFNKNDRNKDMLSYMDSRSKELTRGKKNHGVNLVDPIGVCKLNIAGIHACENISYSKGIFKIIAIGWAITVIFFADFFDMILWAIGWIPIVGDIFGNVVFGNIIDAIAFVTLIFLIGPPALFGLGEFIDIFGFIPVVGDIAAIVEFFPGWAFALFMYALFVFIRGKKS